MPTVRPARPARHLSTLWVLGLAFAAVCVALSGGLPGWDSRAGPTQLADSHFVPDEAVLPAAGQLSGSRPVLPAFASAAEDAPARAHLDTPSMQWNGHTDRLWLRSDGRGFVVSPWGATWWQDGAQRQRTALDLPGLDPALGARQLAGDRLLIPRPEGGAWLVDLQGAQPQLLGLSAEEAAAL